MTVSLSAALTTWQFEPLVTVPAVLLAIGYLTAARRCGHRTRKPRLRRPGQPAAWRSATQGTGRRRDGVAWRRTARPWPAVRTLAFLGGLSAVAVATQSWVGVYDDTSLTDHMVQHLLLIMVAPPLLIAGRPVTLLLHAVGNPWHTRVKRVVRSRAAAALTWPPAGVALYAAAVLGTHLTGLILARGEAHDAEHVAYLLAGYLYFLPVIGSEPVRWRLPVLGRYLLLLAGMPADLVTGAVLMLRGPFGRYGAADVHDAGVVMLAGSDLIMTGLAVVLAAALFTERVRRGRRPANLTAYNAYLASLETPET
jgi:cytochrome c oxidase assembly factor CtaG